MKIILWSGRVVRAVAGIYVVLGVFGIAAGWMSADLPGYEHMLREQLVIFCVAIAMFFGGRVLLNHFARASGLSTRLLPSFWSL